MDNPLSDKTRTLFEKPIFDTFFNPGEVVEIRVPHFKGRINGENVRGAISGYFDDHGAFCEAAKTLDGQSHDGIYFTLQVIDRRLLARAFNRMKAGILTTSDNNVLAYRRLPIDLDPVRPSGISSSDTELKEALDLRETVSCWIADNLPFPKPVKAMSGNGGHLLYGLPDLPVNKENQDFIKNTLEGLAQRFNTDKVKIDTTVFNPARIWKLYGTKACKGDELPANQHRDGRPHRMAYIEDLGGK
ncbi:MAG TPA: hypothetical protein VMT62_12025 [Syntrophorhabdaceae bacterium]|nr:hypothetical protein [Syntrophorhabdaceae bacterium]